MQATINRDFYDLAIDQKLYSNKANLKFYLNYLFNDVDLVNKKVLDVGGGSGLLTFYAAVKGASKVVCLEPECDGSSNGMIKRFNEFKSNLSLSLPIEQLSLTLQDYIDQIANDEYDIIVMHNSINHLNEDACINFLKDDNSYNIYLDLFTKVYNKMKPGGKLIITDCSCNNLFNSLGVKNVLSPTIEWHKHQRPTTWISLLKKIGFKNPKVEWKSPNKLGKVGKMLMGNSFVSYLTISSFKFTIEK